MTSIYARKSRITWKRKETMKSPTTALVTKLVRCLITISFLILTTLRFGYDLALTQLPITEEVTNAARAKKADGRGIKRGPFPLLGPLALSTRISNNHSDNANYQHTDQTSIRQPSRPWIDRALTARTRHHHDLKRPKGNGRIVSYCICSPY